jgi:hypothetical protein
VQFQSPGHLFHDALRQTAKFLDEPDFVHRPRMETMGKWALLMSLETTTASRFFVASAPTVGSKLTRKTSPRLIEAIGYGPLEILIDS